MSSKISFCLVCCNHLAQLKKTLLSNVHDSLNYENAEFIILDYNSTDGTDYWIKQRLSKYIAAGTVSYYKTFESGFGDFSYTKNMAFKLAQGDIICKLEPNDYLTPDFAGYVNALFANQSSIVLAPTFFLDHKKRKVSPENICGKLCVSKKEFLKINGFDEQISKYGFDEYDLVNRLENNFVDTLAFNNEAYIKHTKGDNGKNLQPSNKVHHAYIAYCTTNTSELIVLYRDNRYKKGTLISESCLNAHNYLNANKYINVNAYTLKWPGFETGIWEETNNRSILFSPNKADEYILIKSSVRYSMLTDVDNNIFFAVINNQVLEADLYGFIESTYPVLVMNENIAAPGRIVNSFGFGKGKLFKNFLWDTPIWI